MGIISLVIPQVGVADTTEDVKVQNALTTIQTVINGNLDSTNLSAATSQSAGVNASGQTVKGATNIVTSESRSNAAYGTLTTPDQVTGIVLPTNGLLNIWYQSAVQESVNGGARIAIFIGANQLKLAPPSGAGGPVVQETALLDGGVNINVSIATNTEGLSTNSFISGSGYTGDVTTGQIVSSGQANVGYQGGPCSVFAAAGTYTVSVQFKASSGSVTASNRKLWVQAISFS